MKLAIMQPYFFPYMGYFQLINAVDIFVFYDDVNFIKQGWINRNRILLNGNLFYITINLVEASSYKRINEILVKFDSSKLLRTIYQAYNKSPYFQEVYPLVEQVINYNESNLAKFTINSLKAVVNFLDIKKYSFVSSEMGIGKELRGQERIIEICKYLKAKQYYNAIGGINLYNKDEFNTNNIELKFIKTKEIIYKQYDDNFVPLLSIIDIMMFNSKEKVKEMLNDYELI